MTNNDRIRRDEQPQCSPDWAKETTREDANLVVTARWWGQVGEPVSDGPREVTIRLKGDAGADVRQRGINSGVLRKVERQLNDMGAEVHEMPAVGGFQVMVRQYLEARVAELPDGPRTNPVAYYTGLLDIFDDLTSRGHPEPVNALASVMGIPKDTLKTRLRVARQRRK